MTTSAIQQSCPPAAPARSLATSVIRGTLRAAAAWYRRRTTRRQLESLTLEQLRDVGIDPDVISRGHEIPSDPWLMSRLLSLR
ncbi:MAG: DUF1127 domain-containing protein [Kiloniellaceae bacterium]